MTRSLCLVLLSIGLSFASINFAFEASAQNKIALVIGNSNYKSVRLLKNPANDAKAIAASLKQLGFSTDVVLNLGIYAMNLAVRRFGRNAENADIAVVYYAGHGMELGGKNYLIPVDAALESDRDLSWETITLERILEAIQPAKKLRLVILDACRDNPFAAQMRLTGGATRSVTRGFARVEPRGNTLVAYAARHGTVAKDGTGKHSPYTSALLQHLTTPGLEINFLFRRVRDSVLKATDRKQEPFVYGSLSGEALYLNPSDSTNEPFTQSDKVTALEAKLKALEKRLSSQNTTRNEQTKETKVAVGVFPRIKPRPTGQYKPGDTFKDCETCPEMVVIPAGRFLMGSFEFSTEDEDEKPQHAVTIANNFAIGKFEITLRQFKEFVQETRYEIASNCITYQNYKFVDRWKRTYRKPGIYQSNKNPVTCVNWHDAKAYIAWLSKKTSKTYRLPSEAEWEYVARANSSTTFFTGETITLRQANYDDGSKKSRRRTTPVGEYPPNNFGVYDMIGNVLEWTEDCWHKSYIGAPIDGSPWIESGNCSNRVQRGGSWASKIRTLRTTFRNGDRTTTRVNNYGFRVVRDLGPSKVK